MPNVQVNAFRMKLKPGFEAEYKKRHDEIWPDLRRWWDYMADIMEVNGNNSPVAIPCPEVFRL